MSAEPYQIRTSGELDVNDLFTTKLQEGACAAPLCGHIVKRIPRRSCAADKPFTHSESTLANTDIIYDFSHSGNSINSLFSAIKQTGFGKISPSRIFII